MKTTFLTGFERSYPTYTYHLPLGMKYFYLIPNFGSRFPRAVQISLDGFCYLNGGNLTLEIFSLWLCARGEIGDFRYIKLPGAPQMEILRYGTRCNGQNFLIWAIETVSGPRGRHGDTMARLHHSACFGPILPPLVQRNKGCCT